MGTTSRASAARWAPLVVVAAVLLAALTPGVAWSAPEEKVVICHRTNSPTNPYNQIAVAESSVVSAHGDHVGPIFEPGADEWGDIIPPVPGLPLGRNWPEGQAVLDNGCEMQPDVGPLPTATIGDAQCTGRVASVEVIVSNDPDATQPAFFAILIEGDVVEEVGPVPPGESETVVLDGRPGRARGPDGHDRGPLGRGDRSPATWSRWTAGVRIRTSTSRRRSGATARRRWAAPTSPTTVTRPWR